jgi:subtilisin-like proprotein convertase family protein
MPNSEETISWDVAGTNGNGINVSLVNILLSTDGARTFSTVLASNVSNDGSHRISVPDIKAAQCFVMVEAVGNIFFSVNTKRFSIGEFNEICNLYAAEDIPMAIPDNDPKGVVSIIPIAENASVETVKVRLVNDLDPSVTGAGITHTFLRDLVVTIQSPQGTVVELFNQTCYDSDDIEAIFTDEGVALTCNASKPGVSGVKKPAQELSVFNGEALKGEWILRVIDNQADDEGVLEGWGLEICSSQSVLGLEDYAFDDFELFPNPSDGIFTLKFRTEETEDVELFVYDVLGRKLASNIYKNSFNSFDEHINLSHISKGIYILRIKRGKRMATRKIFID